MRMPSSRGDSSDRQRANRLALWRYSARRQVQPPPPACPPAAASPPLAGDKGKSRVSEWASSHPLSEHRVSDIMKWIKQQYPHDVPSESLSFRRLCAASPHTHCLLFRAPGQWRQPVALLCHVTIAVPTISRRHSVQSLAINKCKTRFFLHVYWRCSQSHGVRAVSVS